MSFTKLDLFLSELRAHPVSRIEAWSCTFSWAALRRPSILVQVGGGTYSLVTDEEGDGLYFAGWSGPADCVLHPRDFSLHRYDLITPAGRARAREYVRRKLKSLAAGG